MQALFFPHSHWKAKILPSAAPFFVLQCLVKSQQNLRNHKGSPAIFWTLWKHRNNRAQYWSAFWSCEEVKACFGAPSNVNDRGKWVFTKFNQNKAQRKHLCQISKSLTFWFCFYSNLRLLYLFANHSTKNENILGEELIFLDKENFDFLYMILI